MVDDQEYRERRSTVPGAVLWTKRAGRSPAPILPDGCMDVIWTGEGLMVAGPDTTAKPAPAPAGGRYVGLRFAPGTAPALLGVPAYTLRDLRVGLADIWPAGRTRRLVETLGSSDRPDTLLESAVLDLWRRLAVRPPAVAGLVGAVSTGAAVTDLATAAGYSERQLRRRFLDAFGYGPKTLARILRVNRALDLARTGTPLSRVAADSGFADQAHLAREVRALVGATPTALLAASRGTN